MTGSKSYSFAINPATGNEERMNLTFENPPDKEIEGFSPVTFDDVPPWVSAYYRDRYWLVCEKSEDLSPIEGRHLQLGALDNRDPGVILIHEWYINRWLKSRSVIHFNWWEAREIDYDAAD